MAVFNPCY